MKTVTPCWAAKTVFVLVAGLAGSVVPIVPSTASGEPEPTAPSVEPSFVPDAVGQFNGFSRRPDGLGFDLGAAPDSTMCKHYQGVARVNADDGTPYLLVSQSRNHTPACPTRGDDPGVLLVVRMESRNRSGERMRSNRLVRDWPLVNPNPDDPTFWPTPPDSRDRVVRTITFDGFGGKWPAYHHPGGMQVIGDVLVLALEAPIDPPAGFDPPESKVLFLDVSEPESPTILSSFDPPDPGGDDTDFSAGLVGITPVRALDGSCCRYLMVVTGGRNIDVRFYLSLPAAGETTTDLTSRDLDWERVGHFSEDEMDDCLGPNWHVADPIIREPDAHQMLNFVRQGDLDGPLFLVGARNTTSPRFADYIDLYQVHVRADGSLADCPLTFVSDRHLTSKPYMGGGDSANFGAASGIYVSPSGELILYATELENDGPFRQNPDGSRGNRQTVRFGEWRHFNVVRSASPTLRPTVTIDDGPFAVDEGSTLQLSGVGEQPATQAWIQLYEDDGSGNRVPGGGDRWLVVDYPDRDADDFDDFGELSFFNQAGSWRWFAPKGCTISANDHSVDDDPDPGPDTVLLVGDGNVHVERDLDSLPVVDPKDARISPAPDGSPTVNYDDDVGSVSFGSDCDDYYNATIGVGWDLDGNGSFERSGSSVTFDATLLDGPTSRTVGARGQHPTDPTALGRGAPVSSLVQVHNVAPRFETVGAFDPTGAEIGDDVPVALAGVPVTLRATFTDPGIADTQTATIDWGDGAVHDDADFDEFSDASGGVTGAMSHSHTFAAGSYDITVEVIDDDGGIARTGITLHVLSPEAALQFVVDELDRRIGAAIDPRVRNALMRARDDLAGANMGAAANGALDELERGNLQAAMVKITHAVGALEDAEAAGAGDLSALKDLLVLAARSIAQGAYDDARAAARPSNADHQRQLEEIARLIDEGAALLAADDHLGAMGPFSDAVRRAAAICRC